jgi:hypothetical protein
MNLRLSGLAAFLSLVVVPLTACSSDGAAPPTYSCSAKGPCPNDPTPSATEASSCESLSADSTCGAAFKAYASCAFTAAICTDAGLSDPSGDSTAASCNSEFATYTTCLSNKINDAGTGGG